MTQLTAAEWGNDFCLNTRSTIINEYELDGVAGTSGQPQSHQFREIFERGYKVIINLSMANSQGAVSNEGEIVSALGMTYIHLPVDWNNPTLENVENFFELMEIFSGKCIWVHCSLNWRVSCFMYLYRRYVLNERDYTARMPMAGLWKPGGVWFELIEQVRREYSR